MLTIYHMLCYQYDILNITITVVSIIRYVNYITWALMRGPSSSEAFAGSSSDNSSDTDSSNSRNNSNNNSSHTSNSNNNSNSNSNNI